MAALTYAQVVEGVSATIASYCQALDDGRTDDVVATFCPDGTAEIPGTGTLKGHDAIRAAYSGMKPQRPTRHVVVNTLVIDYDDRQAKAVSDLIVLRLTRSGWTIQLVGRYYDTLHNAAGTWRFHLRVLEFAG
ncbi:MAG TPA: nuclear transport factor 2 family protein [Streptosporangiaceae bacterium]